MKSRFCSSVSRKRRRHPATISTQMGTFTKELLRGLIVNQKRYGYGSCPCRLSEGDKWKDLDIICPCDYRDPDLSEFGACYCALYVSKEVLKGEKSLAPVPERRLAPDVKSTGKPPASSAKMETIPYPVWRCKVCGYLCARNEPPDVCPICKAAQGPLRKVSLSYPITTIPR